MHLWISCAAAASGLAAIAADWRRRRPAFYLFKPLTTVLIAALVPLLLPAGHTRELLLIALAFCLAGDVALMRSGKPAFAMGLSAFLIGHLAFIAGFVLRAGDGAHLPHGWWWLLVPTLPLLAWLLPRTGKLAGPVLLYFAALAGMVLSAGMVAPHPALHGHGLLLTGALLFLVSDSVLAIRRFGKPFLLGQALTLGTYYAGLWCIVVGSAA